ncbi:hypothetical protein BZA77DRAFT_368986 [Pyronema omphalodes]|nr:hypothetical protein BZA77DRAFT_368986 [Pyronema omphalodes]
MKDTEIHFLQNMDYNLYISEAEWASWTGRLIHFHTYYENAMLILSSNAAPKMDNSGALPGNSTSRMILPGPYIHDRPVPMPSLQVPFDTDNITTSKDFPAARKRSLDHSTVQETTPLKRMARYPMPVADPQGQNDQGNQFTTAASLTDQPLFGIFPASQGVASYYDGSASQPPWQMNPPPNVLLNIVAPQKQQQQRKCPGVENNLPAPVGDSLFLPDLPLNCMDLHNHQDFSSVPDFEAVVQSQPTILQHDMQQRPQLQQQEQQHNLNFHDHVMPAHELPQIQPPPANTRAPGTTSIVPSPIRNPGDGVSFNDNSLLPYNMSFSDLFNLGSPEIWELLSEPVNLDWNSHQIPASQEATNSTPWLATPEAPALTTSNHDLEGTLVTSWETVHSRSISCEDSVDADLNWPYESHGPSVETPPGNVNHRGCGQDSFPLRE